MNIGLKKTINTGGKEISVETGKLAKQADGSVVVRMGDTMLLATVVAAAEAKEGVDFQVDSFVAKRVHQKVRF